MGPPLSFRDGRRRVRCLLLRFGNGRPRSQNGWEFAFGLVVGGGGAVGVLMPRILVWKCLSRDLLALLFTSFYLSPPSRKCYLIT